MIVQDWQQRILNEYSELNTKIAKLSVFIASDQAARLEHQAYVLLVDQLHYMNMYCKVLQLRIARWQDGKTQALQHSEQPVA